MTVETEFTEYMWAVGLYNRDGSHDFHDDTPPPLIGKRMEFGPDEVLLVPADSVNDYAVFSDRHTAQIVADFLNKMASRAIEPPKKFRPVKIREQVTRKLVCKHVL